MSYNGLSDFIAKLKEEGQLIEIDEFVDPKLEITEITDRFSKEADGGKALLFNNNGTEFPLLINAFGNNRRMNLALNIESSDEFVDRIEALFKMLNQQPDNLLQKIKMVPKLAGLAKMLPKKLKGKGACQEVINTSPDLNKLPILTCWPFDGGPFITYPIVNTVDPDTGMRNIGMYRLQQMSENTTGMHWHRHKVGARHYNAYKDRGEKMPISVVLGGDPVYTYAATAPAPDQFDEYIIAGFIRNKSVELVKCITNDLYVPNDADIVIEGYVDPSEELVWEGPFGDHTGFYSLADYYPKFHVTCITHRKGAIYPATIVGVPPMEDAFLGEISEKLFLKPLQIGIAPEVKDMHMPVAGVVHNLVVVSADITYPGQAFKIASSLWGAGQMMFTKYIVVVDKDIDIRDYKSVIQQIDQNVNWNTDLLFSKGPLDILDHASTVQSVGGKLCIDATSLGKEKTGKNMPLSRDGLNMRLISDGVCFIFSNDFNEFKESADKLDQYSGLIVVVEKELEGLNNYTLAWYALGNSDPVRDIEVKGSCVLVNALRKNDSDDFKRPWPDLVVMNDEIINKIDQKWSSLDLGTFIESPSKVLKKVAKEKGAEL
ncbi:MAG: menaquinone biosynthesis decarboxylase [Salinivirgaceae bacterium]|nr:MAG: menaquinone biosynthesis decarboxylase [Salinivirgaceae bacterium]